MKTRATKTTLPQSLATVSASLAATVAGSHAATVQITLSNNKLTTSSNTLNADVTGDGTNDFTITFLNVMVGYGVGMSISMSILAQGHIDAYRWNVSAFHLGAQFAGGGVGTGSRVSGVPNIKYLNPISFTDSRINGGASTQGYLEVNSYLLGASQTIALTRLVFDDSSTTLGTGGLSTSSTYNEWTPVPEPSSLALLALGAGGLAVRRRRQVA